MSTTKGFILQKYGLLPHDVIQKGMEAEVYGMGSEMVLKLYTGTTHLEHLTTLKDFYASIDHPVVSYALPYIHTVAAEGDLCISIERLLPGTPMSASLPALTKRQMDQMMETYLSAALELTSIHIPPDFDRYKLFDRDGLSRKTNGDWHQFLRRYLAHKLTQVAAYLRPDVSNFDARVELLYTILDQPYPGNYHLVHGDYFPGNLLIDQQHQVTALLDFGLHTMYGDSLFDIATGWVFFDMYDELKANLRERYLALTLEALGKHVRGQLYRYVLIYSILSANEYSATCADGHYQWCAANLNRQEYWDQIE
jgi:hypothetical protein